MHTLTKRLTSLSLSLVLMAPVILASACRSNARAKSTVAEDSTWFDSRVTYVDNGLDPAGYFYTDDHVLGMAGGLIVFETIGSEYYDLDDYDNSDEAFGFIQVYDSNGVHQYDKDTKEIVRDHDPAAEHIIVESVSVSGDLLKIYANWNDSGKYQYKILMFDPATKEITSAEEVATGGSYDAQDRITGNSWTADGYSIDCYQLFHDHGDDNHIEFTSPDGEVTDIRLEDTFITDEILILYGFLYLGDSRFCFMFNTLKMEDKICCVDLDSGIVSDIRDMKEYSWIADISNIRDYSYYDGAGNAVLTEEGIRILDVENKTDRLCLSYNDCNINRYDASGLKLLSFSGDKVILADTSSREQFNTMKVHDIHENDSMMIFLEKAERNPNAGKTVISAVSLDPLCYSMAEAIRLYNGSDQEAFIILDSGYDYDVIAGNVIVPSGTDEAAFDLQVRTAMVAALFADMQAGQGPDLILGTMDYTQFNRSDLLLDLSGEVNIPDVYDNIMDISLTGGKLYQVPVAFGLEGILADSGYADTSMPGFTYGNYADYVKDACNGKDPNLMDRLAFMDMCLAQESNLFHKDGRYDYDNADFAATAAFVNSLVLPDGEELFGEAQKDYASTSGAEPAFVNITSGMELLRVSRNNITGKVLMGFPAREAQGPMVDVSQSVGVSASTACPEACKAFVKMLVGNDMQYLFARYDGLSVNSTAQAEVCREFAGRANASYEIMIRYWKDYQIDALDQFVTTSDPGLLVRQMDGYIRSACGIHAADTAVSIIVREEIQAYFAGDKTIEEVMKIIQNRVDLCLKERG
ncbi:MAG: hypothetical protein IKG01_02790 [Lachnospiraceae bacterium]|nr:hypothetical protein [Lachnospiraceae bacterium]